MHVITYTDGMMVGGKRGNREETNLNLDGCG